MATTQRPSTDHTQMYTLVHDDDVIIPEDVYVGWGNKSTLVVRRSSSNQRFIREIMCAAENEQVRSINNDPLDLRRDNHYKIPQPEYARRRARASRKSNRPQPRTYTVADQDIVQATSIPIDPPNMTQLPRYFTVNHETKENSSESNMLRFITLRKRLRILELEMNTIKMEIVELQQDKELVNELSDLIDLIVP